MAASDAVKGKILNALAEADKCLVAGADEFLQARCWCGQARRGQMSSRHDISGLGTKRVAWYAACH